MEGGCAAGRGSGRSGVGFPGLGGRSEQGAHGRLGHLAHGVAGKLGDDAEALGDLVRRESAATPLAEFGQLEGRAYKHTGISFWPDHHVTDDRMKIEWVVHGKPGDVVDVTARHERAGTIRVPVTLG